MGLAPDIGALHPVSRADPRRLGDLGTGLRHTISGIHTNISGVYGNWQGV